MLFEFFAWWYGPGWLGAFSGAFNWVKAVQAAFSIDVLLKTLFSPWKRIVALPGRSLDAKFQAAIDNLISRVIGFFVRIIVLFTALIIISLAALGGLILAIIWPLLPLVSVGLIIWGVLG